MGKGHDRVDSEWGNTERAVFSYSSDPVRFCFSPFPIPWPTKGRRFFCISKWGVAGVRGLGHRERAELAQTTVLCLQVFGDKDADGFYRGEGGGRTGYIPCNMVAEVAVDSPAGRQQLLQRGYLSPDILLEGSGMTCCCPSPPSYQPSSNST